MALFRRSRRPETDPRGHGRERPRTATLDESSAPRVTPHGPRATTVVVPCASHTGAAVAALAARRTWMRPGEVSVKLDLVLRSTDPLQRHVTVRLDGRTVAELPTKRSDRARAAFAAASSDVVRVRGRISRARTDGSYAVRVRLPGARRQDAAGSR